MSNKDRMPNLLLFDWIVYMLCSLSLTLKANAAMRWAICLNHPPTYEHCLVRRCRSSGQSSRRRVGRRRRMTCWCFEVIVRYRWRTLLWSYQSWYLPYQILSRFNAHAHDVIVVVRHRSRLFVIRLSLSFIFPDRADLRCNIVHGTLFPLFSFRLFPPFFPPFSPHRSIFAKKMAGEDLISHSRPQLDMIKEAYPNTYHNHNNNTMFIFMSTTTMNEHER